MAESPAMNRFSRRTWLIRATVTAALSCGLTTSVRAQQPAGTYDAVIQGMTCRQQPSGRMNCSYQVGQSLRFVIAGVGQEDVAVSFFSVDSLGDFHAGFAVLHGCVVVKPTRLARDSVANFAFVSPRDGKVYRSWQGCLQPLKR